LPEKNGVKDAKYFFTITTTFDPKVNQSWLGTDL